MGSKHKLPSIHSRIGSAMNLIAGHKTFLDRNTGETDNPKVDQFILNPELILSNNRHFIADTYMEYQPNGDATTEGQSLLIIGYCYAYMATKQRSYLDMAIQYFHSYVAYFYAGQQIPTSPQRWICNWLCNGKEPTLAHYPLDYKYPTHSGFKDVLVNYTNGLGQVPHGTPYFGNYIDVAYKAYNGALGWDSMVATVYALLPDGSTDWDNLGQEFPVDWVVVRTGDKIDWDGNVLAHNQPYADIGKIQLKDTTVNGWHKTTFAPKVPVEEGGYLLKRNEVWHNRPAHVPLPGSYNQMGNAADAELWFYEACYLLWKITGENDYYNAMRATLTTSTEYSDIDAQDMFFRQSQYANTPWTDGISYDYSYPSELYRLYARDANGFIMINVGAGSLTIEQQSIAYKVDSNSICEINTGCVGDSAPVTLTAVLQMSTNKTDPNPTKYTYVLPPNTQLEPQKFMIPLNKFVLIGPTTRLADYRRISDYGDIKETMTFESNVMDGRDITTILCDFGYDAGFIFGFWFDDGGRSTVTSVTYRASEAFNLRIEDANGYRWYWLLPAHADFTTQALDKSTLVYSGYQPNHPDDPEPTGGAVYTDFDQITFIRDSEEPGTRATFEIYCINAVPTRFAGSSYYTVKFSFSGSCASYFQWKVGNCKIDNYMPGSLNYTPGVIPFSNIYNEDTPVMDAWHGLPYPGYQSPMIYSIEYDDLRLNNIVNFLYDSQVAYTTKFGITGPGMSAYIWDRWDAIKYGPPNTWTMYHWGDGHAWDGYQPRAYYWAARALYQLKKEGRTPPAKLVTYVNNWTTWLISYWDQYKLTPTNFPSTSVPIPLDDDFTGHMCGLWLGGAAISAMAGYKPTGIERLIEGAFDELIANYQVNTPEQIMNGSWSPAPRLGTNNGMFFGFWAGEILKGLGLYIMYKKGADFDWF